MLRGYFAIAVIIVVCCALTYVEAASRPGPVNGGWSRWGRWGQCSKTCAGGVQTRRRTCTNPRPSGGGRPCRGSSSDTRSCPCSKVNGGWSGYQAWSGCSKTCGGGTRTRRRTCTKPRPFCCGASCRGSSTQTGTCNIQRCIVNGGWSRWGLWGRCSKTCAGGVQTRRRTCTNPPPSGGGRRCPGPSSITRSCPCSKVNGGWSYGAWSACSKTCGGGTRTRGRTCTKPRPSCCGASCRGSRTQTIKCNTQSCIVAGRWSDYDEWSVCSNTCEAGRRTRRRTCINPSPSFGRASCSGSSIQISSCNTHSINITAMAERFARAVMRYPATSSGPLPLPKRTECTYGDRDFLFIVDSSGSIGETDYDTAKTNIALIAALLCGNLGLDKQVAVMQFSHDPQEEFAFDEHNDLAAIGALIADILDMTWLNSMTRTWKAFDFARLTMFTEEHGHRPGARKQALIVTDGKSNHAEGLDAESLSIAAAGYLKNTDAVGIDDVELFALYIGNPSDEDLDEIRAVMSMGRVHEGGVSYASPNYLGDHDVIIFNNTLSAFVKPDPGVGLR